MPLARTLMKTLAKTLLLLLLVSTFCAAEDVVGPSAIAPANAFIAPSGISLPDSPSVKPQRTADKKFWTVTAVTAATVAADGWTTPHSGVFEGWNPWLYGHEIRPARTALAEVAIMATFTTTSYILKRKHVKFWWLPMATGAAGSTAGAIHNCHVGGGQ